MNITSMLRGAEALQGSAKLLALAAGPEARAAAGTRSIVLERASKDLRVGAEQVRLLGGPFFERMADDIVVQAGNVTSGKPLAPAIASAMDGASWLLRRVAHAGG